MYRIHPIYYYNPHLTGIPEIDTRYSRLGQRLAREVVLSEQHVVRKKHIDPYIEEAIQETMCFLKAAYDSAVSLGRPWQAIREEFLHLRDFYSSFPGDSLRFVPLPNDHLFGDWKEIYDKLGYEPLVAGLMEQSPQARFSPGEVSTTNRGMFSHGPPHIRQARWMLAQRVAAKEGIDLVGLVETAASSIEHN